MTEALLGLLAMFALLAFFISFIGLGYTNVIAVLVLLAIPPLITNTYVGVRQVDRDTVDAARGQGMTGMEIVRKIELPLALPSIFAGLRTSAVNVVATATIAPIANVQTLGEPIITPQTYGLVGGLGAAIIVAAITLLVAGIVVLRDDDARISTVDDPSTTTSSTSGDAARVCTTVGLDEVTTSTPIWRLRSAVTVAPAPASSESTSDWPLTAGPLSMPGMVGPKPLDGLSLAGALGYYVLAYVAAINRLRSLSNREKLVTQHSGV